MQLWVKTTVVMDCAGHQSRPKKTICFSCTVLACVGQLECLWNCFRFIVSFVGWLPSFTFSPSYKCFYLRMFCPPGFPRSSGKAWKSGLLSRNLTDLVNCDDFAVHVKPPFQLSARKRVYCCVWILIGSILTAVGGFFRTTEEPQMHLPFSDER